VASPQIENGHVKIANEIAEALMKINLSSYQTRILWAIWRKTYGWHKRSDKISVSQLCNMTGLKHGHVSRTLGELEAINIITRTRVGTNRQFVVISFQKDYEKWKLVPVQVYRKTRTRTGSSRTQPGTKLVPVQGDTKEKKETLQKKLNSGSKKNDPRVKVFIDWYVSLFERKFKKKYAIPNGGKIGQQVKNILKSGLSFQDIQLSAMCFMLDEDEFLTGNGDGKTGAGYDIGIFLTRMNKYDFVKARENPRLSKWLVNDNGQILKQIEEG